MIEEILKELEKFKNDRNWGKYHSEPELARSLMIEAAELNRLYQWGQTPDDNRFADEVADCIIYCLNLCLQRAATSDPIAILRHKIKINAEKYPAVDDGEKRGWKI